nr:hypothetical protein [Dyella sp. ASV24]
MNRPQGSDSRLEKDFDILLEHNRRLIEENELLRIELRRHSAGIMQIRSVERSLASAYRSIDFEITDNCADGK